MAFLIVGVSIVILGGGIFCCYNPGVFSATGCDVGYNAVWEITSPAKIKYSYLKQSKQEVITSMLNNLEKEKGEIVTIAKLSENGWISQNCVKVWIDNQREIVYIDLENPEQALKKLSFENFWYIHKKDSSLGNGCNACLKLEFEGGIVVKESWIQCISK